MTPLSATPDPSSDTGVSKGAQKNAAPATPAAATAAAAPEGQPWLAWILVFCTAVVFWPVTRWVAAEAAARQQIMQGIILIGAAAVLIGWVNRRELRVSGQFSNSALLFLALAFGCVGLARWLRLPLLVLPGMALGLAGCLRLLFGDAPYRLFLRPLVIGIAALLVVIPLFPVLDWPLRQIAGINSARILDALGVTSGLSVFGKPGQLGLTLRAGTQSFVVATECNGFGLITSSILLALLAGGISRQPAGRLVLFAALGAVTGCIFNLLRITVICLLAPRFPGHYHAMHEIVGTVALWCGLGLIGWLSWKKTSTPTTDRTKAKPAV